MLCVKEYFVAGADLDYVPAVHYPYTVGHVGNNAEVVGYIHHCQVIFLA